jgi:hypothetical protein
MDIFHKFQDLEYAPSDNQFSATPLGGPRNDFLAKSAAGSPVFLLTDAGTVKYTPGTVFRHVSVQFNVMCRVQSPTGTVDGQFAVLACDASVPELYELFVRCVHAAVRQLPVDALTRHIEACVRSLLDLFRTISAPGVRDIVGLWAELFIIAQVTDTSAAVRAWHSDTFERYDFSWSSGVLEVKATQGNVRAHEFALEQLEIPSGARGLVASTLLQPLTNGVGILDLATQIDAALFQEPALRSRLWSNIVAALGSDFSEKLDRRYDVSFAERHLAIFNMSDIPAPTKPSDRRVSSVRFRSDLTTVSSTIDEPAKKCLRDALV